METLAIIKNLKTDKLVLAVIGEYEGEIIKETRENFTLVIGNEEEFSANIGIEKFRSLCSFIGGYSSLPVARK